MTLKQIGLQFTCYAPKHYEAVKQLMLELYQDIDSDVASIQEMEKLSCCFPEGQLICLVEDELAGIMLTLPVQMQQFEQIPQLNTLYDSKNFHPLNDQHDALFVLEVLVAPKFQGQGIGKLFYDNIKTIIAEKKLTYLCAVSRLSGYFEHATFLSPEAYLHDVIIGKIYDPSLSFNLKQGYQTHYLIPNYYEKDSLSHGYGAFISFSEQNEHQLQKQFDRHCDLVLMPPYSLISRQESEHILEQLEQIPFTFEYETMPSVWGKAFENHLSYSEYFDSYNQQVRIESLVSPVVEKIKRMLENNGIVVEELKDSKSNRLFWKGDFRILEMIQGETILHVDDLGLDGKNMPDFQLPEQLQNKNYHQFSILQFLSVEQPTALIRIYDKHYTERDESFRMENGWQFQEEVIKGCAYKDVIPATGSTFIMNNYCFHDILTFGNSTKWIMYSTYIIYVPDENKAFLYI